MNIFFFISPKSLNGLTLSYSEGATHVPKIPLPRASSYSVFPSLFQIHSIRTYPCTRQVSASDQKQVIVLVGDLST